MSVQNFWKIRHRLLFYKGRSIYMLRVWVQIQRKPARNMEQVLNPDKQAFHIPFCHKCVIETSKRTSASLGLKLFVILGLRLKV